MEIRILVMLALLVIYGILNVAVFVAAYVALSRATKKVSDAASHVGKDSETGQWIDSARAAAEQAVSATETAKRKVAEFEGALSRFQENCSRGLAQADSRLDTVAEGITDNAQKIRDVVATPAFSVMAFSARIARAFETEEKK